MRPKQRQGSTRNILVGLVAVAFAGSLALSVSRGNLTFSSFIEMTLIAFLVTIVASWMLLEDRRMRSVKLSPELICALEWKRAFGFLPYRLVPTTMNWSDVKRIGRRGLVIFLDDGKRQIPINLYLFDDPDTVIAFINDCSVTESKQQSG